MRASSFYSPVIQIRPLPSSSPWRSLIVRRGCSSRVRTACSRAPLREVDIHEHGDNISTMPRKDKHRKMMKKKVMIGDADDEPFDPERSINEYLWSRQYCHKIFEHNCWAILGLLQFDPVDIEPERPPTVAVGFTVMVTLSLPIPVLLVMLHVMDAAKEVLQKLHLDLDDGE